MNGKQSLKPREHHRLSDGDHCSPSVSCEDLANLHKDAMLAEAVLSEDHAIDKSQPSCFKSADKSKEQRLLCECSTRCGTGIEPAKDLQSTHSGNETTADSEADESTKLITEMNHHHEKRIKGSSAFPSTDRLRNASSARLMQATPPVVTPMVIASTAQLEVEKYQRLWEAQSMERIRVAQEEIQENLENGRRTRIAHNNAMDGTAQPDQEAYRVPGQCPQKYPESIVQQDNFLNGDVDSESNAHYVGPHTNASHEVLRVRGCCPTCRWKSMYNNTSCPSPRNVSRNNFSDEEIRLMVSAPIVAFLLTLPAGLLVSAHIHGSNGDGNEVTLIFCFTVIFGSFMSMYVQVKKPEMWAASYAAVLVVIWCMLQIK